MILVTVGMHTQPFDRLVRAADGLGAIVDEEVVIQRGASHYTPTASTYFDFTDEAGMGDWMAKARTVVAHGGAGSILEALQAGKPLVLVPRLKRYGESLDDHQTELVKALADRETAVAVLDPSAESLRAGVEQASQLIPHQVQAGNLQLALRALVAHWAQASQRPPGAFRR